MVTGKRPFEAVVDAHGATVLRVCRAVLGGRHPDEVDDAWSETFLAALRAWPSLAPDANVEAWLVTIAHHKAVDVIRAAGRRAVPVGDAPDARVDSVGSTGHATGLDLVDAIATLPPRQREAVTYHYLGGMPYAQVADLVDRTTNAVRRAASDGLSALRRHHPQLADGWTPTDPAEEA